MPLDEVAQQIIQMTIQLNYYWNFLGLVNSTKNFLPLDIELNDKSIPNTLKLTLIPLNDSAPHEVVFFAVGFSNNFADCNVYVFRPGMWVSKLTEYVQAMSDQQHEPIDDSSCFDS